MKYLTTVVHRTVLRYQLEPIFFSLSYINDFFLKFIPLPKAYKGKGHTITVKRDGIYFQLDRGDYMQWHIYARQPDESWKKAVQYLKDNTVMVDVGANCGAFCLRVAQKAYEKKLNNFKVFAFEPNPLVFEKLLGNLALNAHLRNYIVPVQEGLGNKAGKLELSFNDANTGNGSMLLYQGGNTVSVPVNTLNGYLAKSTSSVAFIKVDVEGYEPYVLEGADQIIDKYKPVLYLEMTERWFNQLNYSQKDIFGALAAKGYALFAEENLRFKSIEVNTIFSENQFNMLALNE